MRTVIQELTSSKLRVRVFDDASAQIIDLARDRRWTMGPVALQQRRWFEEMIVWKPIRRGHPEAYAGRFRAERRGSDVRVTLYAPHVGGRGGFTVRYAVEDGDLVVSIPAIDESITNLTFPGPLEADVVVVPKDIGPQLLRDEETGLFSHAIEWRRTLPWFGGLLDDEPGAGASAVAGSAGGSAVAGSAGAVLSGRPAGKIGWIAILEAGSINAHVLRKFTRAAPMWAKSLGRWDYERRVRYRFVDDGYVGMAKAFRGRAMTDGLYRPLREKIRERPRLEGFIGGRNVAFMLSRPCRREAYEDLWLPVPEERRDAPPRLEVDFTFAQAAEVVGECKRLGMTRGQFKFDGWGQGGYDARHPDVWPPDPAMGSIEEFRQVLAQDAPYMSCIHENYNDIYESSPTFPDGVARNEANEPIAGGVWDGGLAYRTNSRDAFRWAVKNLELTRALGMTGVYFDTLPVWPEESYEPGNECDREAAVRYRQRLLEHYTDAGFYTGAEGGRAWSTPYNDWIPTSAAHTIPGRTPPLFSLSYHDAVFGVHHIGAPEPDGTVGPAMKHRCLEAMLWGWGATFRGFTRKTWPVWKRAFPKTFHVDEWHGRIALAEMTNHAYLSEDGLVERTEWSTGDAITVNFGDEPAEVDGAPLDGLGYRIST